MNDKHYFCSVETIDVTIYTDRSSLPRLSSEHFLHSTAFFAILDDSAGHTPYMAVARDASGRILGHLLAVLSHRSGLLPPHLFSQARIFGEGVYAEGADREAVFAAMLHRITLLLRRRLCLFIEVSDISRKMFGYRTLRGEGYIPIRWQEIHNSLHSLAPARRLSQSMQRRLERLTAMPLVIRRSESREEIERFAGLLRSRYILRLRRFLPRKDFFVRLLDAPETSLLIAQWQGKIVGGAVTLENRSDIYLAYLAARPVLPTLTANDIRAALIGQLLETGYRSGTAHLRFMDVGLPLPSNPQRRFLLHFGGKPSSHYRWFRFSIGWINGILRHFTRH